MSENPTFISIPLYGDGYVTVRLSYYRGVADMSTAQTKKPCVFGSKVILAGLGVAVCVSMLTIAPAGASIPEGAQVVKIEEDWKLVLNEPNNAGNSPQFHTIMSPYGDLMNVYLQTTWNYWETPEFNPGGLQLQARYNDFYIYGEGYLGSSQLSTNAETITWTQVMETNGEVISFIIDKGQSLTWGAFGGETMKLQGGVHIPDLSGYDPNVSVKNSWITYGANRVDLLVITGIRYYGPGDELLYEDTTQRVVYQVSAEG